MRPSVYAPDDLDLHVLPLRGQVADEEPRHVALLEHGVHDHRQVGAPRRLVERGDVHGADGLVRERDVEHRRAVPYPDAVEVLRGEHERRHRARPVRAAAAVRRRRPEAERPVHLDGLQAEHRLLEPREEDGEQCGGGGEEQGDREYEIEAEACGGVRGRTVALPLVSAMIHGFSATVCR